MRYPFPYPKGYYEKDALTDGHIITIIRQQ